MSGQKWSYLATHRPASTSQTSSSSSSSFVIILVIIIIITFLIRGGQNPKQEAIGHTRNASAATSAGPMEVCSLLTHVMNQHQKYVLQVHTHLILQASCLRPPHPQIVSLHWCVNSPTTSVEQARFEDRPVLKSCLERSGGMAPQWGHFCSGDPSSMTLIPPGFTHPGSERYRRLNRHACSARLAMTNAKKARSHVSRLSLGISAPAPNISKALESLLFCPLSFEKTGKCTEPEDVSLQDLRDMNAQALQKIF